MSGRIAEDKCAEDLHDLVSVNRRIGILLERLEKSNAEEAKNVSFLLNTMKMLVDGLKSENAMADKDRLWTIVRNVNCFAHDELKTNLNDRINTLPEEFKAESFYIINELKRTTDSIIENFKNESEYAERARHADNPQWTPGTERIWGISKDEWVARGGKVHPEVAVKKICDIDGITQNTQADVSENKGVVFNLKNDKNATFTLYPDKSFGCSSTNEAVFRKMVEAYQKLHGKEKLPIITTDSEKSEKIWKKVLADMYPTQAVKIQITNPQQAQAEALERTEYKRR